jgi:hypothetical protein
VSEDENEETEREVAMVAMVAVVVVRLRMWWEEDAHEFICKCV